MVESKDLKKIYLFTWENYYALWNELNRWKKAFADKNGADSVFCFNSENWDYSYIKQAIFSWGFFVTNKLVILYWIPLDTEKSNAIKADEIEKIADDLMNYTLPSEVIVVCVSYKPDKRWRFYKWIDKLDKENPSQSILKSFPVLTESELVNFVQTQAKDLWMNRELSEFLIKRVWGDQFSLLSEIEKLRYWKRYNNKDITIDVVDDVCFWILDVDVFKLLDLALTNKREAIKLIQSLEDKWLDWNAINWSLSWWLRNYLFVLDYAEHWITDSKIIAGELKQNPWSITNILKKISILKENKNLIKTLFEGIVDVDYKIKRWVLQPEFYFLTIKKIILEN